MVQYGNCGHDRMCYGKVSMTGNMAENSVVWQSMIKHNGTCGILLK